MSGSTAEVGLALESRALSARAGRLAERFGLPLLKRLPDSGFYLWLSAQGLALRQAGAGVPGPVQVDFVSGALAHRRRFGGGRGQPLARAVGMKPGFNPRIFDATAGLGRDGFVLAGLGSQVTLCERSAVMAALLDDGLERAALNTEIGGWLKRRMRLLFADATSVMCALDDCDRPDVVYLDPMYPAGKPQVLARKGMRALQQIIGGDPDAGDLLTGALRSATRRVVVKRPKRAGWLAGRKPAAAIQSKKTRYDIYMLPQRPPD
jgi:16S rRNA (guanine1516-N2)-methyltransferase